MGLLVVEEVSSWLPEASEGGKATSGLLPVVEVTRYQRLDRRAVASVLAAAIHLGWKELATALLPSDRSESTAATRGAGSTRSTRMALAGMLVPPPAPEAAARKIPEEVVRRAGESLSRIPQVNPRGVRGEHLRLVHDSTRVPRNTPGMRATRPVRGVTSGSPAAEELELIYAALDGAASIAAIGGAVACLIVGCVETPTAKSPPPNVLDNPFPTIGTAPAPLPDPLPEEYRERCRELLEERACKGIPILNPGFETPETTAHITEAISARSDWSVLTYIRPGWPKGWYRNRDPCRALPTNMDCDEYPFRSTREGGPENMTSLKGVAWWDNRLAGSNWEQFRQSCDIQPGDLFIVVPTFDLPTHWNCDP